METLLGKLLIRLYWRIRAILVIGVLCALGVVLELRFRKRNV